MAVGRREFLAGGLLAPLSGSLARTGLQEGPPRLTDRSGPARIRISLNAYSFNSALRQGEMGLDELLDFCARLEFDAVDLTGYYFDGYPDDPPPRQIADVKRKAFLLGIEISGTGVRNDFTRPEGPELKREIALVRQWIQVAARLGAPNLRVFAGRKVDNRQAWQSAADRVVRSLAECAPNAAAAGVMMAIQNHAEFLTDADQLLSILQRVGSPWLGVNLDIGSFPTQDPYEDIARIAPYSIAWQIKEEVSRGDRKEPVDLKTVASILRESQYRGYILLETLGDGDPKVKVPRFLERIRSALAG